MGKELSGMGAAAYVASRNKAGGCKHTDMSMPTVKKLSGMNKAEMSAVKSSESQQAGKRDAEIASQKGESAMYGMKTTKKLGGHK